MKNNVFFNYLDRNRKLFLILTITFILGLCVGVYFVNNASQEQKNEFKNYADDVITKIKNSENINRVELVGKSVKKNFYLIIIMWLLGCSIYGNFLIYIVIFYKGFTMGYAYSIFLYGLGIRKGIMFNLLGLSIQNLILILCLFVLAQSGITIFQSFRKNKFLNLKREMNKYTIKSIFIMLLSWVASLSEVYISTNLLIFFKEIF